MGGLIVTTILIFLALTITSAEIHNTHGGTGQIREASSASMCACIVSLLMPLLLYRGNIFSGTVLQLVAEIKT